MEQIIYLQSKDDLTAIRDHLEWAQSERVLLVLPKGYAALRSPVNLRLLLRHAAANSLEIALVTRDRVTREMAEEQGIAVFSTVERGQRARSLTKPDLDDVSLAADEERLPERSLLPRQKPRGLGRWGQLVAVIVSVLVVSALLGGITLVVLPSAQIALELPAVEVSETIALRADVTVTEALPVTSTIPAREVRVEVKGNARTNVTSHKDMPDVKAQGEIVFTNKTNSEIVLPAGVSIVTSMGVNVRFQTVETITVPAGIGSKATAKIEAVQPGLSGNVRALVINRVEGPEGLQVSAVNEQPTSGGSTKSVLVVGNEDRARLRSLLLQRLQQEAYTKAKAELAEQEILLPETLVTIPISEVYDKFVDEPANELSLDMIIVVKALAASGKDANALALEALEAKVPQGMALIPRTLRFQPGEVKEVQEGQAIFMMAASGSAAPVVDQPKLLAAVRGKPVAWAESYLQDALALASPPDIQLQNGWLGRLPLLTVRIRLESHLVGDAG